MSKSKDGVLGIGSPRNQYKIPFVSSHNDVNSNWYIILTSTNRHFYFNAAVRQSYWQLQDLKEQYFSDNDLEWGQFLNCFEFDKLSVLFAKNIGFHVKSVQVETKVKSNVIKHGDIEVEIVKDEDQEIPDEKEVEDEDEIDVKSNAEVDTDLIRELLQQEGYLKDQPSEVVEDKDEDRAESEDKPQPTGGLNLGYSSSEDDADDDDDDDDGNDEEKEDEEEDVNDDDDNDQSSINEEDLDLSISDSDEDLNEGLDLSIGDEQEESGSSSKKADFINLLNQFKSKISIYDSWFIIEEDLINEFVKHPEYYSIEDSKTREDIFNEWVISQSNEEEHRVDESEDDEEIDEDEEEQIDYRYPTPTLTYHYLLQQFKKDIKSLVYQQFYNKHYKEINDINLSNKEKDLLYRNFKSMILNQTNFEKSYKKSYPNSSINLKKLKLDDFLSQHAEKLSVAANTFKAIQSQFIIPTDDTECYAKWIELINKLDLDGDIVHNCINFIVGDVKRLQSYIDFYNNLL
ncbi:hypothetical protein DFJ63DRAFT_318270 [Scheffersomyces coipomensis]|uniref:uncharacterized protein n=1 Tax=Scheffersomyces coipomensis TaxID=1788519 RepID=UPI00315D1CC2